ncbi:MAG: hypothetical protein ACE5QF_03660 [Thermoplasmata archaeon]
METWFAMRHSLTLPGYRVKKDVRGRTCSRRYPMRLFLFLLSVLLYNLWLLCNLLRYEDPLHPPRRYPISMNKFRRMLERVALHPP